MNWFRWIAATVAICYMARAAWLAVRDDKLGATYCLAWAIVLVLCAK